MDNWRLLIPVLLPIAAGTGLLLRPIPERRRRNLAIEAVVLLTTCLSMIMILTAHGQTLTILTLFSGVDLVLRIDGLGMVFGTMVSLLWPLATLYSFDYMEHEGRENTFFAFYTMTFGVTLGIAFAGNLMTMYLFYEMLTLVTIPLVMHNLTPHAREAGRVYAYYSIGGAAFAFTSLIFIIIYGEGHLFAIGGILNTARVNIHILRFIYVMAFLGFGVKAAVFPLHGWLMRASVAPTPVTALLHAVAVVKSGVFAILRLTYYCFDVEILRGSIAQYICLGIALFTVLYGSRQAVREPHLKRRLAYSTIANLSYILMAACLMTPLGLKAAMVHMIGHGISKICAFFVSGTVLVKTGYVFLPAMYGIGQRMRKTFLTFLIAAMSLSGLPSTIGFIGKWQIVTAAFDDGTIAGYSVVVVLLCAALMSCIYMFSAAVRTLCLAKGRESLHDEKLTDPGWHMVLPLILFSAAMLYLGCFSGPLLRFLSQIAAGAV